MAKLKKEKPKHKTEASKGAEKKTEKITAKSSKPKVPAKAKEKIVKTVVLKPKAKVSRVHEKKVVPVQLAGTTKLIHKEVKEIKKEAPKILHKEEALKLAKEKPVVSQSVLTQQNQETVVKERPKETIVKERPKEPVQQVKPKEELKEVKKETVATTEQITQPKPAPAVVLKEVELELPVNVKDLSIKLQEKPSVLIKTLMNTGIMVGINQYLEEPVVTKLCEKYGCKIKKAPGKEELALGTHQEPDEEKKLKPRSPIVTFMGHVDHGKTSLLDAIRKTKVADSEHGGITQHIGAYRVVLSHGEITFLDTPGHEAFTAMRARGASITDIVVLVVAADDGIMPQTQEAIDHARAAGVPIIVAVNKIDKPTADLDMVKKQLQKVELVPEDWGGKTITVPVSAKTGQGIDDLLEMILLEAQMLELRSNPDRQARGVVIEAKMSKGRGPVATLLVQNGTLHLNENIIVGNYYGKVRAMFNDRGQSVTQAGPGVPVEVLGISDVPQAGEQFFVIADEKQAKELAAMRLEKERQQQIKEIKRISLEDLHAQIAAGKIKDLKIIIKADVQGSLEAIKDTLNKLNVSEIKLDIIHAGVGNINSSDAILAVASNALILGFNVVADDLSKEVIAKEGIDVRTYNIIYELGNDIKAAVEGMLEPRIKKVFLGRAEVRKVFRLSRAGMVAGCFVTKGKINRTSVVSLVRNGDPVFEGKLSSLKRFKDDVKEVAEGFECGVSISGFDQVVEGDIIEAYTIEKIARKL